MEQTREKFATQLGTKTLKSLKALAKEEGRQIQSLVEEALIDLIEKRKNSTARSHVVAAYMNSHSEYSDLYKKLAE